MLLKDVLRILAEFSDSVGFQQGNLYVALFDGAELEDQLEKNADYGVDEIAKKRFSGRPLKVELTKKITSRSGFDRLCRNVRRNYLDVVGGHDELFRKLSALVEDCPMTEKAHKEELIGSCDGTQPDELARFIAACIVCGNFNAVEHKKATGNRLSLSYMELEIPIRFSMLEKQLWTASQHEYIASHEEGNRFHSLDNIIQKLLPSGYFTGGRFDARGRLADGTVAPLGDLCKQTKSHIAIVGEGGIGKTTFLQYLLQNEFMASKNEPRRFAGGTIPFFVELNRCPEHIAKWYSSSLQKTDFITRYVAVMLENLSSLDTVQAETLDKIEKEFQRYPEDGKPKYLLLLDGFNEVLTSDDQVVRTYLSNEITILSQYPNVRIITTSRETQSAYYAADFENIYLVGLENRDIVRYLEESGKPEAFIGEVMNCEPLVQCLRVPLYLCMFSAEESEDNFLPETPGEILYCFFHRNSAFYNARRRARDSRTSALTESQTAFVLDFVLPYIGWRYEESGVFSLNKLEFETAISNGIDTADMLLSGAPSNPFSDFNYSGRDLKNTIRSFRLMGAENAAAAVTTCVHAFLGIVYEFQVNEGPYGERNRYAFCHHHFRDYFSAIWDVQLLSMLQCISVSQFGTDCGTESDSYHGFLNSGYWQHQKADFISQILMEHRNRPQLSGICGDWALPPAEHDEQKVLTNGLDFCRQLCQEGVDIRYLLQNILTAILNGRHELSGLDLRNLDFKHCSFFNVTCSRKGRTGTLAASFDGSALYPENFVPEGHQDAVMEYVYQGGHCFTIDNAGLIKCWDVRSGKLEYELKSDDPLGLNDFSPKGFIKISRDERWLATKIQVSLPDGVFVAMNLFDITAPEKPPKQIVPPEKHSMLNYFSFTEDSRSILFLCDRKIAYCFDIATGELQYRKELALDKYSELYAVSSDSPLYIFTADYDVYDEETEYLNNWEAELDEDDDGFYDYDSDEYEENRLPVLCQLCWIGTDSLKMENLYSFVGMPGTMPTVAFVFGGPYFLLFNYEGRSIERFDCRTGAVERILHGLTEENQMPPLEIHIHPERPDEFFFMYPQNCYDVSISPTGRSTVLMKYPIAGVEKMLMNSEEGELVFRSHTVPTNGRFIVGNDANTYEWDLAGESLILKYNSAEYGCTALLPLRNKEFFALVHQQNGISIFGGNPIRLQNQFCFHEREYYLQNCCYSESRNVLALTFYKPEHERVVLLDLTDSSEKIIFSSIHKGESIEVLCFSDDGSRLLITSQYRCLEYDLERDATSIVALSGDNERLATGYYSGSEIEIAVTEHSAVSEPHVQTRCDFYRRAEQGNSVSYERMWYYIIPEMSTELYRYFIYQCSDLGITGPEGEDGFQTCWITRGFFLESLDELKSLLEPECYKKVNGRFVPVKKAFQPYEPICVRHTNALAHQMRYGASGITFMHLGDTLDDEVVFSENTERLAYQPRLRGTTYGQLRADFERNIGGGNYLYWDYAVPWRDDMLIACHSLYNLMPINWKTGLLSDQIEYTPGVAIAGCCFWDIQADDETKNLIASNGGIIGP